MTFAGDCHMLLWQAIRSVCSNSDTAMLSLAACKAQHLTSHDHHVDCTTNGNASVYLLHSDQLYDMIMHDHMLLNTSATAKARKLLPAQQLPPWHDDHTQHHLMTTANRINPMVLHCWLKLLLPAVTSRAALFSPPSLQDCMPLLVPRLRPMTFPVDNQQRRVTDYSRRYMCLVAKHWSKGYRTWVLYVAWRPGQY